MAHDYVSALQVAASQNRTDPSTWLQEKWESKKQNKKDKITALTTQQHTPRVVAIFWRKCGANMVPAGLVIPEEGSPRCSSPISRNSQRTSRQTSTTLNWYSSKCFGLSFHQRLSFHLVNTWWCRWFIRWEPCCFVKQESRLGTRKVTYPVMIRSGSFDERSLLWAPPVTGHFCPQQKKRKKDDDTLDTKSRIQVLWWDSKNSIMWNF